MSMSIPPIEEEFIHTPDTSEPLWSESFGHWLYSNENNMGLFLHFQRSPSNHDLWREMVIIKCDDGAALVGKSWGINRDSDNPSANALSIRCLEPYKRWSVCFNGALRRINIEDLMQGIFKDGVWEPARLTLECAAHTPVWYDDTGGDWAKAHLEQAVSFSGHLQYSGQAHALQGLGLRDHSYGRRDSTVGGSAQWFNGQFPSGKCFYVTRFVTADGKTHDVVRIVEKGETIEAQIEEISPLEHPEPGSAMYVRLRSRLGVSEIHGEFVYRLPVSFLNASEQVPGRIADDSCLFYYDACLRYIWDGETATGFANVVFAPEKEAH